MEEENKSQKLSILKFKLKLVISNCYLVDNNNNN